VRVAKRLSDPRAEFFQSMLVAFQKRISQQ